MQHLSNIYAVAAYIWVDNSNERVLDLSVRELFFNLFETSAASARDLEIGARIAEQRPVRVWVARNHGVVRRGEIG